MRGFVPFFELSLCRSLNFYRLRKIRTWTYFHIWSCHSKWKKLSFRACNRVFSFSKFFSMELTFWVIFLYLLHMHAVICTFYSSKLKICLHSTWKVVLGTDLYMPEVREAWDQLFDYILTTLSEGFLMKQRKW